jgi:hypothetical protein
MGELKVINSRLGGQDFIDVRNELTHVNKDQHWKDFHTIMDIGGVTPAYQDKQQSKRVTLPTIPA